jgi:DNA-binding winged helix-turn-helix (wHTH) protein/Tfp pilus assembly protein PilF
MRTSVLRFGPFELRRDGESGELRRDGEPVKLQPQPLKVLALLASRPGEVVTREEIQHQVWNGDTFVDFEHGVNFCIRQIRSALGDSARTPHYVETLPRRGYRFVARIEPAAGQEPVEPPAVAPSPAATRSERARLGRSAATALLVAALLLTAGVAWHTLRAAPDPSAAKTVPEARDAYLTGRYLWNKGTADAVRKSLAYFERALEVDPRYAPAHAGLADSYRLLAMTGALPTREGSEKAKDAALEALALDPGLAEARVSLGTILFRYEWDWAGAERELRRAVTDNPEYAHGHHDYAWFLVATGRFDEALAEMELARDADPMSPLANADVGWVYLRARRYDEAIAQIERTLELEPDFSPAFACLELAYVYKGMYAEARDVALRHMAELNAEPALLAAVAASDPAEGLRTSWRWRLGRRLEESRMPYPTAALYAALGEKESAFEFLERAFVERDPMLVSVNVDPAFDGLRADPRFVDLLRRLGLGA